MSSPKQLDLFGEEEAQASSDLSRIAKMANEAVLIEQQIEFIDAQRKELNAKLNELKTNRLPEAMAIAGLDSFTLQDGRSIKLTEFCSGSLPKDPAQKQRAIQWLVENGAASIIKTEIGIEFGRSEHNAALSLAEDLSSKGYAPHMATGVHPSTLQAFAREKLRAGEPIDLDLLGLFAGKIIKIGGAS